MKLELKHLANYLPYGLKGYISEPIYVEDIAHEMDFSYEIDSGVIEILGCTKEISFQSECMFFRMGSGKDKRDGYISFEEDVKLLLRPLSDLTKPCLEGGKVPLTELLKKSGFKTEIIKWKDQLEYLRLYQDIDLIDFLTSQWLFENHFDIYNLIQNGLAIDINTIKEENV